MRPRAWTPDQIFYDGSERMIRQAPKRDCNRCGTRLGDLSDAEMNAGIRRRKLRPVDGECPLCLGFHVVFADPKPIEPGADPDAALITVKLLCPGTPPGVDVAPCAEWGRCGCQPAPGVEVTSVEWTLFLAQICPQSPTKEHRHLVERDEPGEPYVGAPQAGTCWNVNRYLDDSASLAERVGHIILDGPGMYPVEIEAIDPEETLAFELVEIQPQRRAEVVPV
jgi:hypothetical protein